MRKVLIAAVQLPNALTVAPDAEMASSNLLAAERWLDEAGRQRADIACIGEAFNVLGLTLVPKTLRLTIEEALPQSLDRLGALARRHRMYVIAPILGLLGGVPRNAALVIDREGQHLGTYCKVHCTEDERTLGVVPGDEWPTFALDFGRVGVQICHDNSFPESARCLTLNGAEIVFWPHVMGGWGGEFMDVLLRSPAIHNGIYHVPVCYGCDVGRAWRPGMLIGRSSIIGPDATIVADAGRHVGIALAEVDLDRPRFAADFTRKGDHVWKADMLDDRRPETYAPIVRSLESTVSSALRVPTD